MGSAVRNQKGFKILPGGMAEEKRAIGPEDYHMLESEWKDQRTRIMKETAAASGQRIKYAFDKKLRELRRNSDVVNINEERALRGDVLYRRVAKGKGDEFSGIPGIIGKFEHIAKAAIPMGIPKAFGGLMDNLALSYWRRSITVTSRRAASGADRITNNTRWRLEQATAVAISNIDRARTVADLDKAFKELQSNFDRILKGMNDYVDRLKQ